MIPAKRTKKFNTAGPSVPGRHYMIDPLVRIDSDEIEHLIEDQRYFVLHAPRQTGKTTALLALMHHLNRQGRYRALYANIEGAQSARGDVAAGLRTICGAIESAARHYLEDQRFDAWIAQAWHSKGEHGALFGLLENWAAASDRPVILFLDEVDTLVGDTLISLLRQIRSGYAQRPEAFPQTVVLCGVRDVRDYRIHTGHNEIITGGSAFNIKAVSLRLGNLGREDTEALWRQHEEATGQPIDPAIYPELWEDTEGQPWLVNALGHEATWNHRPARDRSVPITLEDYKAARERLIQSRATHLDQLTDKLREARIRPIIADLLDGEPVEVKYATDDLQYVEDIGLIVTQPQIRIPNRIYREIIPRELTWPVQVAITHDQPWYVSSTGRLDMPRLLAAFQHFFREHSDAWLESFQYKEAGPLLLLQAFLQRIVNGGGRVNREYGLGRRRTDLLVEWPLDAQKGFYGPVQRIVIELKLWKRDALEALLTRGLEQTADYADRCGADEAHLVIFDRRPGRSWEERIWLEREEYRGRTIQVWGA